MWMCVLWIVPIFIGCTLSPTTAESGAEACISRDGNNLAVIQRRYCFVTKSDIELGCHRNHVVVFLGLLITMKSSPNVCLKRILEPESKICCYDQRSDILYDSQCLQDVWNKEDRNHYLDFINGVLNRCRNSSQCLLDSKMFTHVQRQIPNSQKYSSYFNVIYQCIPAPVRAFNWCTAETFSGKELHIQGRPRPSTVVDNLCACHVASHGDGDVVVRAIDVRTTNVEFTLRSDLSVKMFSSAREPLFGFREIFTANNLMMDVKFGSWHTNDNIWIHLSESNGENVEVTCENRVYSHSNRPGSAMSDGQDSDADISSQYWPIIYVGAGSFFTLVVVGCVLLPICILRHRRPAGRGRRQPHFYHYPRNTQYDAVWDESMNISDPGVGRSGSRTSNGHELTSTVTSREPTAPPPQDLNH